MGAGTEDTGFAPEPVPAGLRTLAADVASARVSVGREDLAVVLNAVQGIGATPKGIAAVIDRLASTLAEAPPSLPPRGPDGFRDVTCGLCGETFGTNCDETDIACVECRARRCPCCGAWSGQDGESNGI